MEDDETHAIEIDLKEIKNVHALKKKIIQEFPIVFKGCNANNLKLSCGDLDLTSNKKKIDINLFKEGDTIRFKRVCRWNLFNFFK